MRETTIHVRLCRTRFWEVFECHGVEPMFAEKRQAIDYAELRGRLGPKAVRIYDESGELEREIAPPADEGMLYASHAAFSPTRKNEGL